MTPTNDYEMCGAVEPITGAVCRQKARHQAEHDSCDYSVPEYEWGGMVWFDAP